MILGHVATLQCQTSHAPSVKVLVIWYHDSLPIDPYASQRINVRHDGTLEIQEARAADVGLYTCMVC